jgi:RND family efflux transporter MFP subunit
MKRSLMAAALLGVALLVVLLASRSGHTKEDSTLAGDSLPTVVLGPADVAVLGRADIVAGLPVSGTLEPAVKVEIISPFPEIVDEVLVKEGQPVRRGEVLARFRSEALRPAALSAEAQRKSAATHYDRMQNLFKEGAVSARDVEDAEVALRAAEATAAAAESRLDDALVRSPITGTVTRRSVDSGDRVGDGVFMFELVNTTQLEFEAAVPSEHVGQVRVGAPVALGGSGLPEDGVTGRVARVNAAADPATRQVKIYVTVPNREGRVVAGLFASGRVVARESKSALAVPRTAIRTADDGQRYVLVVENGQIVRHDVTVGLTDEAQGLTEITKGLAGGETVIVGPAQGLLPGQRVTITGREG